VKPNSKTSKFTLENVERLAVIGGSLIALFGLYFLIESISASTKAVKIQQRAWVGISQLEMNSEPKDGESIVVTLTIINKGASPATNMEIKNRVSILKAPISDDWKTVPSVSHGTIFPDAPGNATATKLFVIPGTEAPYLKGDLRVWVTGEITYSDVFGRPHWTRFCFSHDKTQNLLLFSGCSDGNEIDREDYNGSFERVWLWLSSPFRSSPRS
jgi:hypothetical protein